MFVRLGNTPLRYAWGARGKLSEYLGATGVVRDPEFGADEVPVQAEVWLGAHHGSPSQILEPARTNGAADLAEWIATEPERALGEYAKGLRRGDGPRLPFLLKVLAAGQPLSLQVHPPLDGAQRGFAAENALGTPIDAPNRNYRDPFHKPELLIALSETMSALAGFRAFVEVRALVADIAQLADEAGCAEGFAEFAARIEALTSIDELRAIFAWLLTQPQAARDALPAIDAWVERGSETYRCERDNVRRIRIANPDDATVLSVLLMNHVELRHGEALYVRAGILHAYLDGVGIELMAASDNVLRGGLTPKHVDAPELLSVLSCEPMAPPRLEPVVDAQGVLDYRPEEPDFRLQRVRASESSAVDVTVSIPGPAIVLALRGDAQLLAPSGAEITLGLGDAMFVTPDEGELRVRGTDVDLVVATAGLPADAVLPLD